MKQYVIYLLDEDTKLFNVTEKYLLKHVNDYVATTNKSKQVDKLICEYEAENLDGLGHYLILEKENNNTTYYVY